jgi:hypothetical protein
MTYAGWLEAAGQAAEAIWRAKYLTEKAWAHPFAAEVDPAHPFLRSRLFEATLARRASDNEFLVARLASPEAASKALAALRKGLEDRRDRGHKPFAEATVAGVTWHKSKFGVHLAAAGPFVVLESFRPSHDPLALEWIGDALKEAGR